MKRAIALLLTLVLVAGLAGCGSSKYSEITDLLDAGDYTGAMGKIALMAAEANSKTDVEDRPELAQLLLDEWNVYSTSNNSNAPTSITFQADGVCLYNGTELTWVEYEAMDELYRGVIFDGGEPLYFFNLEYYSQYIAPRLNIWTCRVDGEYFYEDSHVAGYVNGELMAAAMGSWTAFGSVEGTSNYYYLNIDNPHSSDYNLDMQVESVEDNVMTLNLQAEGGSDETLTAVVELRDGMPVMTVTNNTTGISNSYYRDALGYDKTWPEYRYYKALSYLNEYQDRGYFYIYTDNESIYYDGNKALAYVYSELEAVGDFQNAAGYLSRFTVLDEHYTGSVIYRTDNLGNTSSETLERLTYDEQGRITSGKCAEFLRLYGVDRELQFSYADNSQISQIQYGNVTAIFVPSYDSNGRMTGVTAQYNDGTYQYSYSYNDKGQLVSNVRERNGYKNSYVYTYNDSGKLTKIVQTYSWSSSFRYIYTTTYNYDSNGYLASEKYEEVHQQDYNNSNTTQYTKNTVYTNDDLGRPATALVTENYTSGSHTQYAEQKIEYTYEPLYFYNAD